MADLTNLMKLLDERKKRETSEAPPVSETGRLPSLVPSSGFNTEPPKATNEDEENLRAFQKRIVDDTYSKEVKQEPEEDYYMSNQRLYDMGMQMPVTERPEVGEAEAAAPAAPVNTPEVAEETPVSRLMQSLSGQSSNRQSMIDAAQQERRDAIQRANIERIGESLRAGLGSMQGLNEYEPDYAQAERIEKLGELGLTEAKEDLTLKPEEQMQDPNSEISAQYREIAKELVGKDIPEGISAAQLQKTLPMLQQIAANKNRGQLTPYQQEMLSLRRKELENRAEQEVRRKEQAKLRERTTLLNSARNVLAADPNFKKAVEQGMEFENVELLIDQAARGNQNALSKLGTKLARAMGEVGVLTDTDVVRYVQGQSWGRKLMDWFDRGMKGELSKATLKDIRENLKVLREKIKGDVTRIYDKAQNRMKTAYPDLDTEVIKGLLGAPMSTETDKSVESREKVKVQLPDGRIGFIPKANLQKALDKNAVEIK